MATSFSNLVDNLTKGIHKIKCKDCDCFLNMKVSKKKKKKSIKCKCFSCNIDYSSIIDKELKKQFKSTFKFPNNDINTFILLLRKGGYLNEYMDEREKLCEYEGL